MMERELKNKPQNSGKHTQFPALKAVFSYALALFY